MAFFKRNRPIYWVFPCVLCVRIQRSEGFLTVIPTSKSKSPSDIKVIIKKVEKYYSKDRVRSKYGQVRPRSFQKEGLDWPFRVRKFIQEERHD